MQSIRLAPTVRAAALIATLAGSVASQAIPPATLGQANAKSKYTLGILFSLQEFPDGRVIASDRKENIFRLVDFSKGTVEIVGKQGADAESYRAASTIFRLAGDSLGLDDPVGRKMLHVTPQAAVAKSIPLPIMAGYR